MLYTELNIEETFLVSSVARMVNPDDAQAEIPVRLTQKDWLKVTELATWHRLVPILNYLSQCDPMFPNVPFEVASFFKETNARSLAQHLLLSGHLAKIVGAFQEHEIETIALKGFTLQRAIYPQAGLRPSSDIDLMVRRSDLPRAEELLRSLGFVTPVEQARREEFETYHHHLAPYVHATTGAMVEIHWHIVSPSAPYSIDVDGLFRRAEDLLVDGVTYRVLSPADRLLHISMHFVGDRLTQHVGALLQITDIALVLKKFGPTIDWDQFVKTVELNSLSRVIYLALYSASLITGISCPDEVCSRLRPADFDEKKARLFALRRVIGMERNTPWTLVLSLAKPGLWRKLRFFYKSLRTSDPWSPERPGQPVAMRLNEDGLSLEKVMAWLSDILKFPIRLPGLRDQVLIDKWLTETVVENSPSA